MNINKHSCHICNDCSKSLLALGEKYKTNSVWLVCEDCLILIEDGERKIKEVIRNQESRMVKLLIRKLRTIKFNPNRKKGGE